jgi:hypothetical protein
MVIEMSYFPITRRRFVTGALSSVPIAMLARRTEASASGFYVSARAVRDGGYRATGFRGDGAIAFDIPMPARGHSVALRPGGGEAVFFGRRPGSFALVVDVTQGRQRRLVGAAAGRSFNGHGVFTPDGTHLFASETVSDTGDGMIGIYDPADGYRRVGEWRSGGLDPHDIRLLSDGRTLVVPNGGILQLGGMPRVKLNIPTMTPSLDYIDARSGDVVQSVRLESRLHQLSIRHLAVGPGDRVAIAMQYEGPKGDRVPLAGTHRPGDGQIALIGPPDRVARRLRQYCGSASMDPAGRILGITSPRGGIAVFWDGATGRFLGTHDLADCCGIAPGSRAGEFLISNGHGILQRFDALAMRSVGADRTPISGARWDNHMLAAG